MLKVPMTPEDRQKLIKEYTLNNPLNPIHSDGSATTLDRYSQVVALLIPDKDGVRHITQIAALSNTEVILLAALLNAYEGDLAFVSYAQLLAIYTEDGGVTVSDCRYTLSLPDGQIALRPMRKTISRLGRKLQPFGIQISSILETGYMLTRPLATVDIFDGEE